MGGGALLGTISQVDLSLGIGSTNCANHLKQACLLFPTRPKKHGQTGSARVSATAHPSWEKAPLF